MLSLQLPSWCSCRPLSDGPSLLCARENNPLSLCLSLWMMPLRPLTTWAPMAGPSLVPRAPAELGFPPGHQMCAKWSCPVSGQAGITPFPLAPVASGICPSTGPFPAGLVLCQPSPAYAGGCGALLPWGTALLSCPGPVEVCFGPILGLISICLSVEVLPFPV